jgi:hypothetical protein
MELLKELLEPTCFSHTTGHSVILRLGAGAGDDDLPLAGLGDEDVVKEHCMA